MSSNIEKAKEALAALTPQERYNLAQFMAFHEPCEMVQQSIYECLDYDDVHSDDGKPQEIDVFLGMCLSSVRIMVHFKWDESGEVWDYDKYEFLSDKKEVQA